MIDENLQYRGAKKTSDFTYKIRHNEEIQAFEFIQIDNDVKFSVPRVVWRVSERTMIKFLVDLMHENGK